ncbi:MAG TPA: hypothetical protein VN541_07780 [Tepidisphaeraceae bacterium]|nr:hypothetical protein [Tepidisphaeraceae bacterium]
MKRCAMFFVVVAVAILVARIPSARAVEDAPQQSALDEAVNQFWDMWENRQPSDALRRFSSNAGGAWDEIYRTADEYHSRLGGKCIGHSEIEHKSLGERVEYRAYFALYDGQPVRVDMMWYKAREKWYGIACRVDANAMTWLREAARHQDNENPMNVELVVPQNPNPSPNGNPNNPNNQ